MSKWDKAARSERLWNVSKRDQRHAFEIDRDRVMYSSAFHRLAGVTQIVRSDEADIFHTRQQHTYKVAQVGRRLAQNLIRKQNARSRSLGVDPEVVEAACLAHDLGHPPFGHAGESVLNELVRQCDADGFEGNAQTFRVVCKLAVRFRNHDGLNLTRATLAACLKYPWLRDDTDPKKTKKWGAYRTEKEEFEFAREFHTQNENQTAEAHLMDWADDIAYSVHDLEEFHRCSAIPWISLIYDSAGASIINSAKSKWYDKPSNADSLLKEAFDRISALLDLSFGVSLLERYDGTREQRRALRNMTSMLIGRFINAAVLDPRKSPSGVHVPDPIQAEVKVLKEIVATYVIANPSLAAQQHGQKKIISDVFNALTTEGGKGRPDFLPKRLIQNWELANGNLSRFASDCICSLTERELQGLHGRLFGISSGSVLDPIVR